jgi:hypothetical protein
MRQLDRPRCTRHWICWPCRARFAVSMF